MKAENRNISLPSAAAITRIIRYPVKSMQGQCLSEAEVGRSGLRGDRVRVLMDAARDNQLTARQLTDLLAYEAAYTESDTGSDVGNVHVRSPNGQLYDWNDRRLMEELQQLAETELIWDVYSDHSELTGVDDSPLLLVTESTLQEVARQWKPLEASRVWRRFRPNMVVTGITGAPFEEQAWIGRRLRLGTTVLEVVKGCERCMMVTISPKDRKKDPGLLRLIQEQWGGCLGVYARVVETGTVRLGDGVAVLQL